MDGNNREPERGGLSRPESGGVPPGETPPIEDNLSGTGPRETHNPPKGWGPLPVVVLLLAAALFAVSYIVGWFTR